MLNIYNDLFDCYITGTGDGEVSLEVTEGHLNSRNQNLLLTYNEIQVNPNTIMHLEIGEQAADKNLYIDFDGDGTYDEILEPNSSSGINDLLENHISIYPNPATSLVFVNVSEKVKLSKIQILDLYGRIVIERDSRIQLKNEINVSELTDGCYVMKALTKQGGVINKQFIIRN